MPRTDRDIAGGDAPARIGGRARALIAALACAACGDASVPADYRGEPVAQFPALARFADDMLPRFRPSEGGRVRVAVFWSPLDGDFSALDRLEEDLTAGTEVIVLEACQSFDYIGYTQSAGKTFGDDDFGGSYATLAGLFAPRSDSVAYWCLQYQWNSAYANDHNGLGQADFAAPYEQAMGVAELNLDAWLDEDALAGVNIGASAGADVTLFGLTADVFAAKGKASAEGGEAYIEVMGATVLDKSFSTTLSKSYPVTFFSATQGVDLGIFALVARAELTGTMGATASLSPSSDGVTGTVTPGAALEVNAEAIVDIVVASAGVTGSLSLLDASVPIVATIDSDGWSLTVDIVVTALEGCIEIFGEFMGIGDSTIIADWDGVTLFDKQLFGQSGDF